jgi:O-methyltransferase involved in polyketide biosynthesis
MIRTALFGGDPVAQTLLIPLWARAVEQREPDPLLPDPLASELVAGIDADWGRIGLSRGDLVQCVVRAREFDRFVRDFLTRHPDGTVVHLGCGLDTRFQRVDNGRVHWFDLDLPEVIAVRRTLVPEAVRYHYLAASVFDPTWFGDVPFEPGDALMFVAEAVLPYFPTDQVRDLVCRLRERFPGAELVTDTNTAHAVRIDNLHLAAIRSRARMHWSMRSPAELETWSPGIRLVESFSYFDDPEPRMGLPRWFARVGFLAHSTGIHRYRLGEDAQRT